MTTQQRLSSFGFILSEEGVSKDDHAKLKNLGEELESLYSHAMERAQKIDDDPELTGQGKNRRKKVLTKQISESLEKYGKLATMEMEMVGNRQSWALELRRLRESLQTQPASSEDRVLNFLEQKEIRDYLRSIKEPIKIEAAIRAQADAGNWQFLDAALHAPEGSQHFILDKSRELLEAKRLRSLNPEKVQRISEIKRSQRTLSNMVASLKQSLNKAGLFEEPEQGITFLNAG